MTRFRFIVLESSVFACFAPGTIDANAVSARALQFTLRQKVEIDFLLTVNRTQNRFVIQTVPEVTVLVHHLLRGVPVLQLRLRELSCSYFP
jgi:hypothetical protein